jgi:hypothetical protein
MFAKQIARKFENFEFSEKYENSAFKSNEGKLMQQQLKLTILCSL